MADVTNGSIRQPRDPARRIRMLAGQGQVEWLPAAPASPHLARYGIAAQPGDGIVTAALSLRGDRWLVGAQDERFIAGTIGAEHGEALAVLFDRALSERPGGVVLLLASGGVRLHEANAAEIAVARALRRLLDVRAAGIPVLAVVVGDVFGASAVLAFACDRLALLPGTRIGLSGPKVIEAARGKSELDADDAAMVDGLFGASARAQAGMTDLLSDDRDAVVNWLAIAARDTIAFPIRVVEQQERLATRLAASHDDDPEPRWLEADPSLRWLRLRAAKGVFGPKQVVAADCALLAADDFDLTRPRTVLIEEDSAGHPCSRAAETLGVAQYLAHHAAVLALLRSRGHRIVGWLAGTGHSAAFFVNALQADVLYAAPGARIVAMPPSALARVTGLDARRLAGAIEEDRLLGHPVAHFAALGGVTEILRDEQALPARI